MGWEGRGLSSATVHVGNSRSRATDTQRMEVLDSIVLQLQLLLSNHSRPRHHIHVNEGAGKGKGAGQPSLLGGARLARGGDAQGQSAGKPLPMTWRSVTVGTHLTLLADAAYRKIKKNRIKPSRYCG